MNRVEPILDRRDSCGVVDLTPFEASLEWQSPSRDLPPKDPLEAVMMVVCGRRRPKDMTLSELITVIRGITGESENQIRFRVQNWRRDGLLPTPPRVSANRSGSGGTRGEWGQEHVIGYLAIELLRPNNKPLSIVLPDVDQTMDRLASMANVVARILHEHPPDGGRRELYGEAMARAQRELLPLIQEAWGQNLDPSAARRLRLNTSLLQELLPLARGETFDELVAFEDPWRDAAPTSEGRTRELLKSEGLRWVWRAVCQAECGKDDRGEWIAPLKETVAIWDSDQRDALVFRANREMWRLSTSRWSVPR